MRWINLFLLSSIAACSTSTTEQQIENKVKADIDSALSTNDKRLYFIGGRVPNFPGIKAGELDKLISQCGKQLVNNSSDIIMQDDDLKARELAFKYAEQYNKLMKVYCLKN